MGETREAGVTTPTSGAVLAGGRSRRLGIDKTTMPWPPGAGEMAAGAAPLGEAPVTGQPTGAGGSAGAGGGRTLLEVTAGTLAQVCDEVLVVAYRGARPLSYRVVPDLYPQGGSLGGIYSALAAARHEYLLAVATDMPFLSLPLLRWMLAQPRTYDVLVPVREEPEPLHAIYSRRCLEPMRRRLAAGQLKITGFFADVEVHTVDEATLRRLDPEGLSCFNINTPDDLARARALLAR